jgi:hypothetical protein
VCAGVSTVSLSTILIFYLAIVQTVCFVFQFIMYDGLTNMYKLFNDGLTNMYKLFNDGLTNMYKLFNDVLTNIYKLKSIYN